MATRSSLLLLFLSIFLLSSTLALSSKREDPEERFQQCQQQCQSQHRDPRGQSQCQRRCQEEYREERERQEQGRGGERDEIGRQEEDPEQRLQECQQQCQRQRSIPEQQGQCQRRCEEEYRQEREREEQRGRGREMNVEREEDPEEERREQEREERGGSRHGSSEEEESEEEEEGQQGRSRRSHPYSFDRQSFRHLFRTQHGNARILERFSRRSELLRGIEKYRLAILEANPSTFVMPKHCDADEILYVVRGRGKVGILQQENRESHNIRCGDILRVPAGSMVYFVNDENERLHVVKLLKSVSSPGHVEEFFAVGGENPESFFRIFSDEVLESAFNAPRERLERVFGQQRKGAIIRASQEQIRAMARRHSSEGGFGGGESKRSERPFNLLNQRPTHSNNHGQLYEADCNDYRPLADLNVQVSFANISSGSMIAPFYNSRATKVAFVLEGKGYFEMACPHLSRQREEKQTGSETTEEEQEEERRRGRQGEQQTGVHYQKVRSRLTRGTAYVIPAGHPVATVASRGENLQIICFDINAQDNQKNFLAGRNNILNKLEREAKELSFNVRAREVDQVLNSQRESVFLPGPEQRREREGRRGRPLESILDFAGF